MDQWHFVTGDSLESNNAKVFFPQINLTHHRGQIVSVDVDQHPVERPVIQS